MRENLKIILLGNLIGVTNALICGIIIPLISMRDFSFPMVPQDNYPFLGFIMTITSIVLNLIVNLIVVNLALIALPKVKTRKKILLIIVLMVVITVYLPIILIVGKDVEITFYLLSNQIPGELWITSLVYLLGFYLLFIRKMQDKPDLSADIETEDEA